MLEESESKHEETVAATQQSKVKTVKGPQGPVANLTITKPPELAPMSDAELARMAREEGKDVELNENNEIVDKRDLLSAGLNLAAPNTRRLGVRATSTSTTKKDDAAESADVHRAAGTAASRKEINERRRREILAQMEEQRRLETDQQREEREANARVVARRNDDAAIQSALERYRARKRQKLEAESNTVGDGAT